MPDDDADDVKGSAAKPYKWTASYAQNQAYQKSWLTARLLSGCQTISVILTFEFVNR